MSDDDDVFMPDTPPLPRFVPPSKRMRKQPTEKVHFVRLLKRAAKEARETAEDHKADNVEKASIRILLKNLMEPADLFDIVSEDDYYNDDEFNSKSMLDILRGHK